MERKVKDKGCDGNRHSEGKVKEVLKEEETPNGEIRSN